MANKYADKGQNTPKGFQPTYAAFTAVIKYTQSRTINIFGVKTNKAKVYNWGYSGGKEEEIDEGNLFKTRRREYLEETTMDDPNPSEKYFSLTRRNNQGSVCNQEFANHFLVSFQEIEPTTKPKLSPKESVEGFGWFNLSEFENLMLKQNHRIAFIELCYWLEEKHSKSNDSLKMQLSKCAYQVFERPSTVGNVLRFKFDDRSQTTDYSKQALPFLINPKLFEGFKIYKNHKESNLPNDIPLEEDELDFF
jgi:hypothetical protein